MRFIKQNGLGMALCLGIAVVCFFLGQWLPVIGGPVFAILAGMILTMFLKDKARLQPGIAFTSKRCCNTR